MPEANKNKKPDRHLGQRAEKQSFPAGGPSAKPDWSRLLQRYESYLLLSLNVSDNTAQAYVRDLQLLQAWMEKEHLTDPALLQPQDLQRFCRDLSKDHSPASIQRLQSALRSFYDWLGLQDESLCSPAATLRRPRQGRSLPQVLSDSQVDALLATFDESDLQQLWKTFFMLCYGSGLRVSECCGILMQQISLEERQIRVLGKGGKERLVFLHPALAKQLQQYRDFIRPRLLEKPSSFLFPGKGNGSVSRTQAHYQIKKHLKLAGLPAECSTHTLRHAFATRLMEKQTDLRLVQELLGHADISTTQIYTHVDAARLHRVYDSFMPDVFDEGGNENEL